MKLYHYSKDKYPVLKTKRLQGSLTKEEIKRAGANLSSTAFGKSYVDHISFFFDPVPLILLPKIFKGQSKVWFKGNHLVEYTVETEHFEKNIHYQVVESPEDINARDEVDDYKWDKEPGYSKRYFERRNQRKIDTHEVGNSLEELNKQIQLYQGRTEEFYLKASKRSDFDENILKYAANVPHLMIYPSSGIIKYESSRNVVVGYEEVPKVNLNKVGFQNW